MASVNKTWVDPEEVAYPDGGMKRRARVKVTQNTSHPVAAIGPLVGKYRMVRAGIADTYFSIPAVLRVHGVSIRGYISSNDGELVWTPNGE